MSRKRWPTCGALFVDDCPETCELPRFHDGEWHVSGDLSWSVNWDPELDAYYPNEDTMGADVFYTFARGETAQAAFDKAVEEAEYEHGHGGYTGTIAEKSSFHTIPWQPQEDEKKDLRRAARRYAYSLVDNQDSRIENKWGAAGCIKVEEGVWLFFGWASS